MAGMSSKLLVTRDYSSHGAGHWTVAAELAQVLHALGAGVPVSIATKFPIMVVSLVFSVRARPFVRP